MPRNNIYKFLKYANTGEEEDKKPIGLSDYISEGHATDDLALGLAHMFEGMADMTERALRPDNMTPTEWKEHQGGVLKNYLTGLRGSAANLAEGREQPELEEFSAPYFLRGALMSAPETVATMVPAALIGGPLGAGAAGVGRMIGAPLVRGMLSTAQGRALEFALQKAYQSENLGGKLARALTPNNAPMLGAMHVGAMMEANSERQQEINAQIRKALENGTYRPDETELAAERATQGIYDKDKWLITALNYPQFRAFATPTKSLLGNLGWGIGGTLAEGTEEALQEVVRATEMGEPVQGRNLASSFGTGMLLGGAMHGIGSTANYASRQISGQAERDRQIEEALNAYKEQRKEYSDRVGRVTVNDDGTAAYDNTPYGDIRQTVRDRANLSEKQAEIWDAAQYASARAKEKYGYDISPELIYKQWAHEAGVNFDSPNAIHNNNFGGLTQTEPNGEENKQPDGNNYYRHFNNVREYADAYVDDFIKYYPEISGTKNEREFASVLKKYGYFGDSVENYAAGMEGISAPTGNSKFSGNIFGVENYAMPTQGDNITQQVSQLKNGWSDVIPQIGGVLKEKFGLNATISSAARSADHNAEVGGAPNSYHIVRDEGGDALDIVFDRDTTQEEQDRIADYFKGTGLFSEVLYHDVGSGAHLHLGGLKTENLSRGVQFDSRTLTRPSETRRTQHNQLPQEEIPKPLFDLNAEDEQTQKLLERFASERVQSLANAENPDRGTLGFFTGLFNEAGEFQNTEANRAALRERYGAEITPWANEILKQESPAQPAAPARTQSSPKPRQGAPKVANEDILTATDNFLERLRTDRPNDKTLLELEEARRAGDVAKMESILRQNNVEIAPVESTAPVAPSPQPPVQSENVVQNNQPPENILSSEQETAQPQQETNTVTPEAQSAQTKTELAHINRVSKATNLANKNEKALDNIVNSIQWLAAQNNIVIPAKDLTKLKKRNPKTISEWRDRLTEAGALTVKPAQETTSAPPAPQQTEQPPAAETTATPKETPLQAALRRGREILDTQRQQEEQAQRQQEEQALRERQEAAEAEVRRKSKESYRRIVQEKAERERQEARNREIEKSSAIGEKYYDNQSTAPEANEADFRIATAPISTESRAARAEQGRALLRIFYSEPFRDVQLPAGLEQSLERGNAKAIETAQGLLESAEQTNRAESQRNRAESQRRARQQQKSIKQQQKESARILNEEAESDSEQFASEMMDSRFDDVEAREELFNGLMDTADEQERQENAKNAELEQRAQKARKKALAPVSESKSRRKEQGRAIEHFLKAPSLKVASDKINATSGLMRGIREGSKQALNDALQIINDEINAQNERREIERREREAAEARRNEPSKQEKLDAERRADRRRRDVRDEQADETALSAQEEDIDRRYRESQQASENAQQGLMEGTAESVQRQRENDQAHREWESEDLDDLFYLEEEIADLDRTEPEPRGETREETQENVTRQEQPAQEDDRDVFDLLPESNELNGVESTESTEQRPPRKTPQTEEPTQIEPPATEEKFKSDEELSVREYDAKMRGNSAKQSTESQAPADESNTQKAPQTEGLFTFEEKRGYKGEKIYVAQIDNSKLPLGHLGRNADDNLRRIAETQTRQDNILRGYYRFKSEEQRDEFIRKVQKSWYLSSEIERQRQIEKIINPAKEEAYRILEADKYPEIKDWFDSQVENAIRNVDTIEDAEALAEKMVKSVRSFKDAGKLHRAVLWELGNKKFGDMWWNKRKNESKYEFISEIVERVENGGITLDEAYEETKHFLKTGKRKVAGKTSKSKPKRKKNKKDKLYEKFQADTYPHIKAHLDELFAKAADKTDRYAQKRALALLKRYEETEAPTEKQLNDFEERFKNPALRAEQPESEKKPIEAPASEEAKPESKPAEKETDEQQAIEELKAKTKAELEEILEADKYPSIQEYLDDGFKKVKYDSLESAQKILDNALEQARKIKDDSVAKFAAGQMFRNWAETRPKANAEENGSYFIDNYSFNRKDAPIAKKALAILSKMRNNEITPEAALEKLDDLLSGRAQEKLDAQRAKIRQEKDRVVQETKTQLSEILDLDNHPALKEYTFKALDQEANGSPVNSNKKLKEWCDNLIAQAKGIRDKGEIEEWEERAKERLPKPQPKPQPDTQKTAPAREEPNTESKSKRKTKGKWHTVGSAGSREDLQASIREHYHNKNLVIEDDGTVRDPESGIKLNSIVRNNKGRWQLGRYEEPTSGKADITGAPNIDTSNVVAEKDLTPAQKLLVSFGKKLGVEVVFFNNPEAKFRGVHKGGKTFLNINGNKELGGVFWHESFHWLKNNNPELYKALVKAAGITDAQRQAYLEESERTDLKTDEAIDEEILADMMDDVAKRTGLFQSIAGKNRGLIERVIQWFKDTLNKFIDHFRNPQGKLTTAQAQALASEFGRIANQLKDANGNQIFRYNRRTHNVELANNRERTEAELAETTAKNAQFEAKYSVDSNDNSTKSFKQRLKNLLGVEGKNIPIHKQMKRQLEDLSDMKIAADHLPEGVQVKIDKIAGVIRTGREYDWANILPEVGNAVAEQLGITQSAEMGNYIGKFILNGAPNDTSAEAKEFAKAMRENTEMYNKVMAIRGTFDKWNNMSAEEQMIASTRYDKEIPPLKERAQKFWQYLRTELFDTQMPIHYHVAKFAKATGIKLSESINPEIAFRNLRGMQQRAMRMVYGNELTKEALQKMYPNVDFSNWKPIAMILESIKAEPGSQRYKQFDQFVKASHFLDIHQHNYKVLGQQNKVRDEIRKLRDELDKADTKKKKAELTRSIKKKEESLEALKQKIMDTPDAYTYDKCADLVLKYSEEFGEAQKDLVQYSRVLLDIMADSGMISRRRYHQMLAAYPNYVPLHREFDENPNLNTADSMKQMLGSTKDVKDAIAAIANNTFDYIQRTEKNKAKLLLANLANFDGVGGIFELVDGSSPNDGTIIHFYENGKRKALQCSDEDIVKAVNSMNQPTMNLFLKVLQVPALLLRTMATARSPGFILGNFLRDPQDAWMVSKSYHAGTKLELLKDFAKSLNPFVTWSYLLHAIQAGDLLDSKYLKEYNGKMLEEYRVSGAAQSDFFSFDRDYKAEAIERLTKKNLTRYASPKGVFEFLRKAGEITELATRLYVYDRVKTDRAKKHGGINIYDDLVTAAFESRDFIDFARHGNAGRTWNTLTAFANPVLQGFDKQWRTYDFGQLKVFGGTEETQKKFCNSVARLFLKGILPAIVLSLLHKDEDWYKDDVQDWEKENYWIITEGLRVPKGADLGLRFFSNLTEHLIASDPVRADKVLQPLKGILPDLMPTAFLPIFECMANYDLFRRQPIVPQREVNKFKDTPELQYDSTNSKLAVLLGRVTGVSPRYIDHVIYGYTSGFGKEAMHLIDTVTPGRHTAWTRSDVPFFSRILRTPYRAPKIVSEYYEEFGRQESYAQRLAWEKKHGNPNAKPSTEYDPALHRRLKNIQRAMQNLNAAERAIMDDPKLTSEQVEDKREEIQKRRVELCRKAFQRAR